MRVARIPHTSLPGTTKLFTDLLYDFDQAASFYPHQPRLESVEEAFGTIDYPEERRAAVVAALRAQNGAAGEATSAHLDLLAQPDTVAVATGQQVGLFGGPVFSVYKALTAAKYAELLRSRGRPAVAVFWLATEDHDLAEVDHAWVFNGSERPQRTEANVAASQGSPVGDAKLPSGVANQLREAFSGTPFGDDVCRTAAACYAEGRTLGQSFRALFEELLRPYGLIFLDPMDAGLRSVGAGLIRSLVNQSNAVSTALAERGSRLEGAGYHQQVAVGPGSSLLFRVREGRRSVIRRSGDRYLSDGSSLNAAQLLQELDREPESFSPNALLRPVFQDYLLPTAAFIGGPAELAYLAQSAVIYDLLLGRMPVLFPRSGFTILDRRAKKALDRYGLSVPDCFSPRSDLQQHIADLLTPPALKKILEDEGGAILASLERIRNSLAGFDPTLGEAFTTSSRKIQYQLQKAEAKAAREGLRRDERSAGDAERLSSLIYPQKTLQERLYCVLPFLAQYGDRLIPTLYEAIDPECRDHQVLVI